MNKFKKHNVIKFPDSKVSEQEKEIEAIVFAAAEPLDIQTIESKINDFNLIYFQSTPRYYF